MIYIYIYIYILYINGYFPFPVNTICKNWLIIQMRQCRKMLIILLQYRWCFGTKKNISSEKKDEVHLNIQQYKPDAKQVNVALITGKPLNSGQLRVFKKLSLSERCLLLGGNFKKIVTFVTQCFVRYSWYVRCLGRPLLGGFTV